MNPGHWGRGIVEPITDMERSDDVVIMAIRDMSDFVSIIRIFH